MTQRVSSRRSVASGLACMVMGATALVGGFASPAGASPQTPAAPSCPAGYVEASGATAHAADTEVRATGGEVVTNDEQASEVDAANLGTEGGTEASGQSDILGGIVPRVATQENCVPEGWEPGTHGPSPAAAGCCGDEEEPPGHECCTTTTMPEETTTTPVPETTTTTVVTEELPRTGSTTGPMVAAGIGLLVVGGALVVGKRKLSQA